MELLCYLFFHWIKKKLCILHISRLYHYCWRRYENFWSKPIKNKEYVTDLDGCIVLLLYCKYKTCFVLNVYKTNIYLMSNLDHIFPKKKLLEWIRNVFHSYEFHTSLAKKNITLLLKSSNSLTQDLFKNFAICIGPFGHLGPNLKQNLKQVILDSVHTFLILPKTI